MMFDNPLIKEIEGKKEYIMNNFDYYSKVRKRIEKKVKSRECINSYILEHPHNLSTKEWTEHAREGIPRLCEAWESINHEYPSDIISKLTPLGILNIGSLVDPYNDSFRHVRVSLGLKNYTPPSPLKVDYLINNFLDEIKSDKMHYIEKAAFAHTRIAAIQPFLDGNKRTARLIQNKILYENCLPPATIPVDERSQYLDYLEQSMAAYNDAEATNTPSEIKKMGPFFYYISKKVNNVLDNIINEIK